MAGCMVGGPALLFAGNALHPVNHKTDEAAWLAGIAAHRSQWYAAHLLGTFQIVEMNGLV